MMTKIITTFILLLCFLSTEAQYAYFGTRGTIAFDKITFTKARIRSMTQQQANSPNSAMRMRGSTNLDNVPESTTEKLILHFDENSTVLTAAPTSEDAQTGNNSQGRRATGGTAGRASQGNRGGRGAPSGGGMIITGSFGGGVVMARGVGSTGNQSKVFYQDLKKNTSSLQIELDDKYTITDTLNNITWRFTDEYRNIAGYECRRVNGATADSLYLVAFYTDQIPVSAGPALTSGLPGMILGLAIPEMHIQYWATQINYSNDTVPSDWRDKKATAITFHEFVKNFGRMFQRGRDSNTARRQIQEQLIY